MIKFIISEKENIHKYTNMTHFYIYLVTAATTTTTTINRHASFNFFTTLFILIRDIVQN